MSGVSQRDKLIKKEQDQSKLISHDGDDGESMDWKISEENLKTFMERCVTTPCKCSKDLFDEFFKKLTHTVPPVPLKIPPNLKSSTYSTNHITFKMVKGPGRPQKIKNKMDK